MPRTSSKAGFATFSLENLVLGLLVPGPRHGYQLYQDYERHFLPIWKVGRSKFYAALATLHDSGHLAVQTELQDDRPPRKIYHLTDTGRSRFQTWLYQPVTPMRAIRVEFLAKLQFLVLLQVPDAIQIIDAQIDACEAVIRDLDRQTRDAPPSDDVLELVYDFRRRQAIFIIEWLRVCRERLNQEAIV